MRRLGRKHGMLRGLTHSFMCAFPPSFIHSPNLLDHLDSLMVSLSSLSAFNNILSNLGHVLLGFLFLLIVLRRDILHRRALEAKDIFAMVRRGQPNQMWELGRVMVLNCICKGEGHLAGLCGVGLQEKNNRRPEAWVSRLYGYITSWCLTTDHALSSFRNMGFLNTLVFSMQWVLH